MPTQEAKAHHVGEWASLRNTSLEIAEAIFELAKYDEKLAEKFGKKAAMKCSLWPSRKRIKTPFSGANRPSSAKTCNPECPAHDRANKTRPGPTSHGRSVFSISPRRSSPA
jgi:hypothetical protein